MRKGSLQGGFSLLEVMMAAGTLGIVSLGVLSVNFLGLKGSSNTMITFQADNFRRMLTGHLQNDESWKRTVAEGTNASLACIRNNTDCRGAGGTFAIYDARPSLVYNPMNPASGFDLNGATCSSFNPAGNDRCPFRTEYRWTAICPPSGACLNPQVSISGATLFRPSANNSFRKVPFNETAYGINLVRNAAPTTIGTGNGYYLAKWFSNSTLGTSGVFEDSSTANIGIGNSSPQAKLDITGQLRVTGGNPAPGRVLGTLDGSGLASWIDANGAWEKNGASVYYNGGNVGIGYNNPAHRLHVNGTVAATDLVVTNGASLGNLNASSLTVAGAAHLNGPTTITSLSALRFPSGAAEGRILVSDANGNATWRDPTASDQLWKKNGTTIFYGDGRVGVGTNNPAADLEAAGTARFGSFGGARHSVNMETGGSSAGVVFRNNGGGVTGAIQAEPFMSWNGLRFYGAGPNPLMSIYSQGLIGMGMDPVQFSDSPMSLTVNGPVNSKIYWNGSYRMITLSTATTNMLGFTYDNDASTNIGVTTFASSRHLKTEIKDLEIDTSRIFDLKPYSYYYKDDTKRPYREFGFIAEDVVPIYPSLTPLNEKTKRPMLLNYAQLTVPIIVELKKVKANVDRILEIVLGRPDAQNGIRTGSLVDRVNKLEKENAELKEALCELHPKARACTH